MIDQDDYRQIALETPLLQKPFWVERWDKWVTLRELPGSQRSELLQKSMVIDGKKSTINMKVLYPMLVVLSARYPDPACPPPVDHAHYHQFPGVNGIGTHPKAGELIFSITDIAVLNQTPGGILELLNKPASELSGLREEDIEEKKDNSDPNIVESVPFTIG